MADASAACAYVYAAESLSVIIQRSLNKRKSSTCMKYVYISVRWSYAPRVSLDVIMRYTERRNARDVVF